MKGELYSVNENFYFVNNLQALQAEQGKDTEIIIRDKYNEFILTKKVEWEYLSFAKYFEALERENLINEETNYANLGIFTLFLAPFDCLVYGIGKILPPLPDGQLAWVFLEERNLKKKKAV